METIAKTQPTAAEWVCRHWISVWFAVRHTGGHGHTAEQARLNVRYWLGAAHPYR